MQFFQQFWRFLPIAQFLLWSANLAQLCLAFINFERIQKLACILYLCRQQYIHCDIITPPSRGSEYCNKPIYLSICVCVCLSVSISMKPLDQSSQNFVCGSPVAVARSSSGGDAICYVLPVLWLTSRWAIMGHMALAALRHRGGVWCLWMPSFFVSLFFLKMWILHITSTCS